MANGREIFTPWTVIFHENQHDRAQAYNTPANRIHLVWIPGTNDRRVVYASVQDVPVGIFITNTDYWVQCGIQATGAGGNIDDDLTGNTSLLVFNATSGEYEEFTLTDNTILGTNASNEPASLGGFSINANHFGFGSFPNQSDNLKCAYHAYYDATPTDTSEFGATFQQYFPMDLCADKQNRLMTCVTGYNSGTLDVIVENAFYHRINFGHDFAQIVANRDKLVSKYSSFQGRYLVLFTDGTFYSRNHAVASTAHFQDHYLSANWLGHEGTDSSIPFLAGHTVIDFDQNRSLVYILTQDSADDSYHTMLVRFHSDGTVDQIGTVNVGAVRPSEIGFVSYGDDNLVSNSTKPYDIISDTMTLRDHATALTAAGSTPAVKVYPYRTNRFFIRAASADTQLTEIADEDFSSPIVHTDLPIPNAIASAENGARHGFVAIYNSQIRVYGTNNNGELGDGMGTVANTAAAPRIHNLFDATENARRHLKGGVLTITNGGNFLNLWSDVEVWFAGLINNIFDEVGRLAKNEVDDLPGERNVGDTSTLRPIFATGDTINDFDVRNHSNNSLNRPALSVLLNNGTVFESGNYVAEGDPWKGNLDNVCSVADTLNYDADPNDMYNMTWRIRAQ